MNNKPELSIIVPVYNVQNYLELCLDSIVNQSFKNREIIIIDDASTDNSASIIREYEKRFPELSAYFMTKNIGVGEIRNLGIEYANGTYIGFVDGDDWIDTDFYYNLMSFIKSDNSDIAICGIKDEFNNFISSHVRYKYGIHNCIEGKYALKLLTKSENFNAFITPIVNNKIYNKNFIVDNKIKFNSNRSFQDDFFSFFACLYAKRVSLVPDTYYHYYQRVDSVTHVFSKNLIDNCFDTLIQIRTILEEKNLIDTYTKEYYSFVERCIRSLLSMMIHKETDLYIQKKYLKYIFEIITRNFNMHILIDYLDNNRIFDFWEVR
ncbi:glycosyltransferase family 2 protein [Thomasclavelia cocleata]|uniref:glycosyltransferase family 2 protein n=1 Tax=Thomasclavelia cocleata TaxID=69824 RepID=UPI00272DCA13|nr:glycosyltransferase [Thomasclavelia cocleata]